MQSIERGAVSPTPNHSEVVLASVSANHSEVVLAAVLALRPDMPKDQDDPTGPAAR